MSNLVKTKVFGDVYTVNKSTLELSVKTSSGEIKTFDKAYMTKAKQQYNRVNRIHKPMALLFWTDVKNNNTKNWTLL